MFGNSVAIEVQEPNNTWKEIARITEATDQAVNFALDDAQRAWNGQRVRAMQNGMVINIR